MLIILALLSDRRTSIQSIAEFIGEHVGTEIYLPSAPDCALGRVAAVFLYRRTFLKEDDCTSEPYSMILAVI